MEVSLKKIFCNIFFSAVIIITLQSANVLALESDDIGISFKPGKYESKRIFFLKDGKEQEIKLKGELFVDPVSFKKSSDGDHILFLDAVDYNEFDSYVYLYDIKKDKTHQLILRNIRLKFMRDFEWFDTHSFIIDIFSTQRLNFTIGHYGPIYNGIFLVKFDDDFKVIDLKKIEW
jgi:hypothetical protein